MFVHGCASDGEFRASGVGGCVAEGGGDFEGGGELSLGGGGLSAVCVVGDSQFFALFAEVV